MHKRSKAAKRWWTGGGVDKDKSSFIVGVRFFVETRLTENLLMALYRTAFKLLLKLVLQKIK
jgi:hypothetical protein